MSENLGAVYTDPRSTLPHYDGSAHGRYSCHAPDHHRDVSSNAPFVCH